MTIRFYGGLRPSGVIGHEKFAGHDPVKSWDDGGIAADLAADIARETEEEIVAAIDKLKQTLTQELANYGAHQVRDGVVDYVANGLLDLAIIDGRVQVVFDASNNEAEFRAHWDLDQLLMRCKTDAQQQGDGDMLYALADLHSALPEIAKTLTGGTHTYTAVPEQPVVTSARIGGAKTAQAPRRMSARVPAAAAPVRGAR